MNLGKMREATWKDVSSDKHAATFAAAKLRETALRDHTSPAAMLEFLRNPAEELWPERDAVARAMVREYQRARGQLWLGLLFVAFAPMLMRLRGRLVTDGADRSELDMLVVEQFFDAVANFPLEARASRTSMFLRQDTQRAVFRKLLAQQRDLDRQRLLDHLIKDEEDLALLTDTPPAEPVPFIAEDEKDELADTLCDMAGDAVPQGRLQLVIDTLVRGEGLRHLVDRRYPELSARAKEMTYQRLKRERLRTIARLRPVLMPNAPQVELRLVGAA